MKVIKYVIPFLIMNLFYVEKTVSLFYILKHSNETVNGICSFRKSVTFSKLEYWQAAPYKPK